MWLRLTFKNNVDTAGYTEPLVSHLFRSMEMLDLPLYFQTSVIT